LRNNYYVIGTQYTRVLRVKDVKMVAKVDFAFAAIITFIAKV